MSLPEGLSLWAAYSGSSPPASLILEMNEECHEGAGMLQSLADERRVAGADLKRRRNEVLSLQDRTNGLVLGSPLLRPVLFHARERVGFRVLGPRPVVNDEIEGGKLLCPARLASIKDLGRGEVGQILMVRIDVNAVGSSVEILAPTEEPVDHG